MGRQISLRLNTPEALAALEHSAMLLSLGASPLANEYEGLIKDLAYAA
ncbi:MAG TPA: hypothetical protein VK272_09105 [Solirubrobacteraceae bacterium]|nr:hypothetical protein [Solirubrobacteraceae bacterium]